MSVVSLRPYQDDTLAAIRKFYREQIRKQLICLPTGGGKTVCFATMIKMMVEADPQGEQILVLAHRDELIKQAADKILKVAPELAMQIGFIKGKQNDIGKRILIASVQTLSRPKRLRQLSRHMKAGIIDEAHHAPADGYQKILEWIEFDLLTGWTATPERTDSKRLDRVFDVVAYEKSIESMIAEGYLVPPRGKRIGIEVDFGDVKNAPDGDFAAGSLADALDAANAPSEVLGAYLQYGENRKGLIFCPTVAQAHETAEVFRRAGIPTESVDGTTEEEERVAILQRLGTGATRLVANVGVLTEGFDEPSISCIIMASPTKSRSKYCQIIGRGLRLHPSKEDCLVLDLAGASDDMSIQSLPAFFGLKDDEDILDAIERRQSGGGDAAEAPAEDTTKKKPARRDQRVKDVGFFPRDRFHWLRVPGGWLLDLGDRKTLVLRAIDKQESGWQILLLDTSAKNPRNHTFKLRAEHPDLSFGQGMAEEIVREEGLLRIVDRNARWRNKAVTENQLKKLAYLRVEKVPRTCGEASNLIARAESEQLFKRIDRALARQSVSERSTRQKVPA